VVMTIYRRDFLATYFAHFVHIFFSHISFQGVYNPVIIVLLFLYIVYDVNSR
jgi:hypothetical protein